MLRLVGIDEFPTVSREAVGWMHRYIIDPRFEEPLPIARSDGIQAVDDLLAIVGLTTSKLTGPAAHKVDWSGWPWYPAQAEVVESDVQASRSELVEGDSPDAHGRSGRHSRSLR
jgi:hypothetical protein